MIKLESILVKSSFRMPGDNHVTQTVQAKDGKTSIVYDPATGLVGVIEDSPTGVRTVRCIHASKADELTLCAEASAKFIAASGLPVDAKKPSAKAVA